MKGPAGGENLWVFHRGKFVWKFAAHETLDSSLAREGCMQSIRIWMILVQAMKRASREDSQNISIISCDRGTTLYAEDITERQRKEMPLDRKLYVVKEKNVNDIDMKEYILRNQHHLA